MSANKVGILKQGDAKKLNGVPQLAPEKDEAPKPAQLGTIAGDAQSPATISNEGRKCEEFQIEIAGTDQKAPVPAKPQHHRTVSWGDPKLLAEAKALTAAAPKLSPVSPAPSQRRSRTPSGDSVFSFLTQTDYAASPQPSFRGGIGGGGGVDLDDILKVNPFESEAETLILMAIEKQETLNRARTGSVNSAMLGNVPNDSVHVFMPQLEEPEVSLSNNSGARSSPIDLHATRNSETPVTTNRSRTNTIESSASPPAMNSPPSSGSNRVGAAPLQRPPLAMHKRNVTMADNLATLTEALAGYHGADPLSANYGPTHPHGADEAGKVTPSAGETLAKNANLIFRGRQKTEGKPGNVTEDVSNHSDRSGRAKLFRDSSNWGKLRNSVAEQKNYVDTSGHGANASVTQNDLRMSGSVEAHKKTDCANDDIHVIQNDIECGAVSQIKEDNEGENSGGMEIGTSKRSGRKSMFRMTILNTAGAQNGVLKDFHLFIRQRRTSFFVYLRFLLLVVFPALAVAVILFYFAGKPNWAFLDSRVTPGKLILPFRFVAGNPPTGRADLAGSGNGVYFQANGDFIDPMKASASWWIIFVCVSSILAVPVVGRDFRILTS